MAEEYWCQRQDLVYCDGDSDITTPNHECVVIQHYASVLMQELRESEHEGCQALGSICESLLEDEIVDVVMFRCLINDSLDELYNSGLVTEDEVFDPYDMMVKHTSLVAEEVSMAVGQGDVDAVLHAQRELGWIRIKEYQVDLWHVTRRKLKDLAFALEDSDLDLTKEFTVEDRATGRLHRLSHTSMQAGVFSLGRQIYEPKPLEI